MSAYTEHWRKDRNRVQKKLPVDEAALKRLRNAKLVEGRKPHVYVSAAVASVTSAKAEYINTRGLDDEFYVRQIIDYLAQFGGASRQEIDKLLLGKLSVALDAEQKKTKIGNLLTGMRVGNLITNVGTRKTPRWVLKKE